MDWLGSKIGDDQYTGLTILLHASTVYCMYYLSNVVCRSVCMYGGRSGYPGDQAGPGGAAAAVHTPQPSSSSSS